MRFHTILAVMWNFLDLWRKNTLTAINGPSVNSDDRCLSGCRFG